MPAGGSLVETYLVSRGLHLPPTPTLRFHAGLKHPSGGNWPAMVALVTRGADDTPLAIHRTYLARDGGGEATLFATGCYADRIVLDGPDGAARFAEKVVILDSRQIDTLLAIPL